MHLGMRQHKLSELFGLAPLGKNPNPIKITEVLHILENENYFANITTRPPCKPHGGYLFLFSFKDNPEKVNDWRCDQYRWEVHNGKKCLTCKESGKNIVKSYHKLSRQGTFERQAWWLADNPSLILMTMKV